MFDCQWPQLGAAARPVEDRSGPFENMSVPPFGAGVTGGALRSALRVANPFGTNLLAHCFELRSAISVNAHDHRLWTFKIPESGQGVLLVPVTDRIRHGKTRTIVVEHKAISFRINTLALHAFRD